MNIFLTGEINTGKTTIINEFLKGYRGVLAGYKTIRIKMPWDNFFGIYLLDINDKEFIFNISNKAGDCHEDKSLKCYESVFETLGVSFLRNSNKADLVIMDEIGVLEKDCEKFKDEIIKCLDADINVLGVIKQTDNPFLNSIASRQDVQIIEVTSENNNRVLNGLMKVLY